MHYNKEATASTMPVSRETHAEFDLTIFTAMGSVPFSEQMDVLKSFYNGPPTGNVVWDFTHATEVAISGDELRAIIQYTGEHAHLRPAGTTVLVVNTTLKYGLARMASAYAELEATPWDMKIFETLDAALGWIKQSRRAATEPKQEVS